MILSLVMASNNCVMPLFCFIGTFGRNAVCRASHTKKVFCGASQDVANDYLAYLKPQKLDSILDQSHSPGTAVVVVVVVAVWIYIKYGRTTSSDVFMF